MDMNKLKELREEAGLTLRELESYVSIAHTSLSELENDRGNRSLRLDHILKLATFYSVTGDYLIGSPSALPYDFIVKKKDGNYCGYSEKDYLDGIKFGRITRRISVNLIDYVDKNINGLNGIVLREEK
jgi:transcriptional regulator with XRE-family HTH domain